MITRRATFRLYPSSTQEVKLYEARRLHAYLYNACVEHRKTSYQRFGQSISYFHQQNLLPGFKQVWLEYKQLGAHSLQATVKRVDFAFNRFFQGLVKYPKFKSIRHYSAWSYPDQQSWVCHSVGLNGFLELNDLGMRIQMRGKTRVWGTPTTCTILHRNGKWYASITVAITEAVIQSARLLGTGAIGADIGCKDALAIVDDQGIKTKIEAPQFLRKAESEIRSSGKAKRRKRPPKKRKQKASRRWKAANRKESQLKSKVGRQRQNWSHQVSAQIARSNSMVGTEELNVNGMTRKASKGKRRKAKSGLNKSILDVGFGMLRSKIVYKISEGGGIVSHTPTRKVKPTQRCAKCGHLTPKQLSERMHVCSNPNCNHIEYRDWNSAEVSLLYAKGTLPGLGTSLIRRGSESSTYETKTRKHTGSFKQLAERKRQKLSLSIPLGGAGNPALKGGCVGRGVVHNV